MGNIANCIRYTYNIILNKYTNLQHNNLDNRIQKVKSPIDIRNVITISNYIAIICYSRLKLYEITNLTKCKTYSLPYSCYIVSSCCKSPDNTKILIVQGKTSMSIFNFKYNSIYKIYNVNHLHFYSIFIDINTILLIDYDDNNIYKYNITTNVYNKYVLKFIDKYEFKHTNNFKFNYHLEKPILLSGDNKYLIIKLDNGNYSHQENIIFDLLNWDIKCIFYIHSENYYLHTLKYFNHKNEFCIVKNNTIEICNVDNPSKIISSIIGNNIDNIDNLIISYNDNKIIINELEGDIHIYNIAKKKLYNSIITAEHYIKYIKLSDDDNYLCVITHNDIITVYKSVILNKLEFVKCMMYRLDKIQLNGTILDQKPLPINEFYLNYLFDKNVINIIFQYAYGNDF